MALIYLMEALVWMTWICTFYTAESLDCFDCKNAHNISECHTTVQCLQDQHCYTEVTGVASNTIFNLGCRNIQDCWTQAASSTSSPIASIVGRQVRDYVSSCTQCCSQNFCNHQLCSHSVDDQDGQCEDHSDYNCELISGAFNVCSNLHQAKTYCRKWCGLCNFTDGGWSDWTSWGSCDVTCSSGHRSRSRSCTNPKPSVGGLNCAGNSTEISQCTMDTCPVHGNWTTWTSWGTCSVSCGVGLERRDRTCTLPAPGPHGHPCVGDYHEDRVCMTKTCTEGHWSSWTAWGTCSATCNGGIKVKHRSCNNPAPSPMGKYCEGSNTEYTTCNSRVCSDTALIPTVVFKARAVSNTSPVTDEVMIFTTNIISEGGGYDNTTGIFTAPVDGVYSFNIQFCVKNGIFFFFAIVSDNKIVTNGMFDGSTNNVCSSADGIAIMKKGMHALVKCTIGNRNALFEEAAYRWNTFSGVLLHT